MSAIPTPTPHNSALKGDFAKTVLMPGDPLRAKLIAETFLVNANLVNNVRGVQGYTGTYRDINISVMASGMGMPSMAIYSHELFNAYDVDNIIRIGSAGAMQSSVKLRDIVLAMGACTNSGYAANFGFKGSFAPIADFGLLCKAKEQLDKRGANSHVGNILTSDSFYCADSDYYKSFAEMGVLAVEMETAALYLNAAQSGKNALAICTISDHIVTGEALSSQDRQNTFVEMIEVALDTAVEFEQNRQ